MRCIRLVLTLTLATAASSALADAGDLDPFFGDGGTSIVDFDITNALNDDLRAMAIAPDGRIVAVAESSNEVFHVPLRFEWSVARLKADGGLDETFAGGGRLMLRRWFVQAGMLATSTSVSASIGAVAVQADGKIVLAGYGKTAATQGMLVARLTAAGVPDTKFGGGDGIAIVPFGLDSGVARAVLVQPDGRIVAAGSATPGGNDDIAVARLDTDGSVDATFGTNGRAVVAFDLGGTSTTVDDDMAYALALQSDGKIVAAGSAQTPNGTDSVVVRLTANGVPDPAFGNVGTGRSRLWYVTGRDDVARAVAVSELPTRRIVVAGYTETGSGSGDMAVSVLDGSGLPDPAFSGDGRVTIPFDLDGSNFDSAAALNIRTNVQTIGGFPLITRKIVVAGTAAVPAHVYKHCALARLGFDGVLDPTFGVGGKRAFALDVDQDGMENSTPALAMNSQGTMAIIGSDTYLSRPGAYDRALLFFRAAMEP